MVKMVVSKFCNQLIRHHCMTIMRFCHHSRDTWATPKSGSSQSHRYLQVDSSIRRVGEYYLYSWCLWISSWKASIKDVQNPYLVQCLGGFHFRNLVILPFD